MYIYLFLNWMYCFQSHCSLCVKIVYIYFPVSSYRCAFVPSICIVGVVAMISLSGLHSFISRFINGRLGGGCMCVVSLCCA
jgi:hypothetical protein